MESWDAIQRSFGSKKLEHDVESGSTPSSSPQITDYNYINNAKVVKNYIDDVYKVGVWLSSMVMCVFAPLSKHSIPHIRLLTFAIALPSC
jgi:hypothetical protein